MTPSQPAKSKFARRDRVVGALANFTLRFASKHYRDLIGGSVAYGLRAAAKDSGKCPDCANTLIGPHEGDKWCRWCDVRPVPRTTTRLPEVDDLV